MESTPTAIVLAPQPRDRVLEATRAYNETVNSDGATATVWDSLAADLDAAADSLTGGRATFCRDRANDCRSRALYARRILAAIVRSDRRVIDIAA